MLASSVSCSRLSSGAVLGARIPRVAFSSRPRLLSTTALQRTRLSNIQKDVRFFPSSSRHFWWSSSSSKTPAETSSPVPSQSPTPTEVVTGPTALTERPPVESSSVVNASSSTSSESVTTTSDLVSTSDAVSSAASNVPYIPPPMQYGDLALLGLTSYTPAGLSRWTMELIHLSCGLPWGPTILTATLLTRLALFPFSVIQLRNTARMAPHQAEILALREELNNARGNSMAIQRAMLKQKALNEKMGVNMFSMMVMPLVQLPVTLGMFFGVKGLCDSGLEALKWSGWAWLPDLSVADPTGILPVAATVAMNIQLTLGLKDMAPNANTPHIINLFRVLSVGGLAFMFNLPAGVLVYLLTSIISISAQTALLRLPAVRRAFNIPVLPPTAGMKSASFGESIKYLKDWWNEQKKNADRKAKADRKRSV